MKPIQLGPLEVDPIAYGIHGNAILGIKESGKSYAGTMFGERLIDAGIPFTTFDPIGIWRNMKVPGRGKGYPVIVAAVTGGDLPLTVASAPEIVRAAMKNRVSLVIDLFDIKLSKADWRRIVRSCVEVMLYENSAYGLRHVFLEEAAEFVPQMVSDGETYAAVEKLARMGGNSRLGYTLISPRAQEINKAVLELCENMFLFRQRGKNALTSLDKWLSIAGQEQQKEIIAALPDLAQGECWVWLGGDHPHPPVRVKMPTKNSFHPDRRAMGAAEQPAHAPVDVAKFVQRLRSGLEKFEAEAAARDPVKLQALVRELQAALKRKSSPSAAPKDTAPDPAVIARIEQRAYRKGYLAGHAIGAIRGADEARRKVLDAATAAGVDKIRIKAPSEDEIFAAEPQWTAAQLASRSVGADQHVAQNAGQERSPVQLPATSHSSGFSGPQIKILRAISMWHTLGNPAPTREMVAAVVGYSSTSGGFKNPIYALNTAGAIRYPEPGTLALIADIEPVTLEAAKAMFMANLSGPQQRILEALSHGPMERAALAEQLGYSPTSGGFKNPIYALHTMTAVNYPNAGSLELAAWVSDLL